MDIKDKIKNLSIEELEEIVSYRRDEENRKERNYRNSDEWDILQRLHRISRAKYDRDTVTMLEEIVAFRKIFQNCEAGLSLLDCFLDFTGVDEIGEIL